MVPRVDGCGRGGGRWGREEGRVGGCGIIAASMWLRVDQGRLHAISRGGVGGDGGGGRASGGVVVLGGQWQQQQQQQPWCRREASEQKCGLAGSLPLPLWGRHRQRLAGAESETAGDNARGRGLHREYGHVAYLGEQSPNKTTTCNNTSTPLGDGQIQVQIQIQRGAASRTHVH